MKVLLIDDNPQMVTLMQKGFESQGISADAALMGNQGEESALRNAYDVIILDRMLPDRDGLEVCRNLRRSGVCTPLMMLTARGETDDKVDGLNAGADDYLAKPFEFEELMARIRALVRRNATAATTKLTYEDLTLDLAKRTATRAGRAIPLTTREFSLLEYLMNRRGRVVSRTSIGEAVWDMNYEPSSNVIDVYVSMLRRKIDRGFDKPLIHTVIGSGYYFSNEPPAI